MDFPFDTDRRAHWAYMSLFQHDLSEQCSYRNCVTALHYNREVLSIFFTHFCPLGYYMWFYRQIIRYQGQYNTVDPRYLDFGYLD